MYFFPSFKLLRKKKEDFFFSMGVGKWTELSSGPMDLVIVIIF